MTLPFSPLTWRPSLTNRQQSTRWSSWHALRGKYPGATVCKACTASCMLLDSQVWFEIPFKQIEDIYLSEPRCLIISSWTCLEGHPYNPQAFGSEKTEFENKLTEKRAALRTGCSSHGKSEFVHLCSSTELKSCLPGCFTILRLVSHNSFCFRAFLLLMVWIIEEWWVCPLSMCPLEA